MVESTDTYLLMEYEVSYYTLSKFDGSISANSLEPGTTMNIDLAQAVIKDPQVANMTSPCTRRKLIGL